MNSKARQNRHWRRRGGALPRALLLALVAGIAGVYLWATFAPQGQDSDDRSRGPVATVALSDVGRKATSAKRAASLPKEIKRSEAISREKLERPPGAPGFVLPRVQLGPPLAEAPDPALVEAGPSGPLPIIGKDGREPRRYYARPFKGAKKRPRIAIMVTGLGLSGEAAEAAIRSLPGAVTLAFVPYARRLKHWISEARAAGHEVLLDVAMEPAGYPEHDPGPKTLLTSLSGEENLARLYWAMGRASGFVGVSGFMGARFSASRKSMRPVLADLKKRGLLFLDNRSAPRSVVPEIATRIGLAWASATAMLDARPSREAIDARLAELEHVSREEGRAVGLGSPLPVTLERIAKWTAGLNRRGIDLAPVSALTQGGPAG